MAQRAARTARKTAETAQPDVKAFDKQLAEARAQMKKMQEQMNRIRETSDPQERQRLMQEHYGTRCDRPCRRCVTCRGPGMMGGPRGMHGPGMMGRQGMMGWGGMPSDYSKLTPEQLKERQYMMNQYIGMQQMMIDQMMSRQQWMSQPPPDRDHEVGADGRSDVCAIRVRTCTLSSPSAPSAVPAHLRA